MGAFSLQYKTRIVKATMSKVYRHKDGADKGAPGTKLTPLPSNFVPGDKDVICSGRGKSIRNHPGNRFYQETIEQYLPLYAKAKCKLDKSLLVNSVIATIRDASPNAGFVREEHGRWYEASDLVVRERIGASLRDLLHTRYSSSSPSKRKQRKAVRDKLDVEVEEIMVRQNCKEIVTTLGRLPYEIEDDDKLQDALNKANRELLAALKNGSNENATEKRNTTNEMSPSLIDSLSNYTFQSDDGDNTEPIPYAED